MGSKDDAHQKDQRISSSRLLPSIPKQFGMWWALLDRGTVMHIDGLDFATKTELIEAFLACPKMQNRRIRENIVARLTEVQGIERNEMDRADVANIVERSLDFKNGLAELREAVRFYERDSVHMQRVDAFFDPPLDEPPGGSNQSHERGDEIDQTSFNYRPFLTLLGILLLGGLMGIGWLVKENLAYKLPIVPASDELPIVPASDDEMLILVTDFYSAAGIPDAEPHRKIAREIQKQIRQEMLSDVRVELEKYQFRENEKEAAQRLADRYNASIIIWGDETSTELIVQFLNLRQPEYAINEVTLNADENNVYTSLLANPKPYTQFINQGLPTQLTFLALFALAQAEHSKGDFDNALTLCEAAIEYGKEHNIQGLDQVYFYLGRLYQSLTTDQENAIDAYKRAIETNPTLAAGFNNLGILYGQRKMYKQALFNLNQAYQLQPEMFAGNWQLIEKLEREVEGNISLTTPTPVAKNLIRNPNFDNGLADWEPQGDLAIIQGYNGGNAVQSVQDWAIDGPAFWHGIDQRNIPVAPNQMYLFSAYYQFDNSTGTHFRLDWRDSSGTLISVDDNQDAYWEQNIPNGWQQRSKIWTSPPDAATVNISILHGVTYESGEARNVANSTLKIDDVYFGTHEYTPKPTPLPIPSGFNCDLVSEIPLVECQALVALYNGTDGPNWIHKNGWLVTNTPCSWYEVSCTNGRVTTLDLDNHNNGNNLSGDIPVAVGNLTALTQLDLSHNQLSSLPTEISNLTNLTRLSLSANQLSRLPTEIGNLTNLTELYISSNQLISLPAEIGNLINLTWLSLDTNQLISLPTEIGNLTNLTNLFLNENQLSSLPRSLTQLTNLDVLRVGNNMLTDMSPELQNFLNTENLDWADSQTSFCSNVTQIPQNECEVLVALYHTTDGPNWRDSTGWLETTTPCDWYGVTCTRGRITALELLGEWREDGNHVYFGMAGAISPEIGNLVHLTVLDLSVNRLFGTIPTEIGNLSNLQKLILGTNQFSGSIPTSLSHLSDLEYLYLGGNQLTGTIPPELGNLLNLKHLYLWINELTDSIPPELGQLSNLTRLYLADNNLTGGIPTELGALSNLISLRLQTNELSESIPVELGNLSALTELYLAGNDITGPLPDSLGQLSKLLKLHLEGNQLSGSMPDAFCELHNLDLVILRNNGLSGPLPVCLSNWTKVATFHFDETELCKPQDDDFNNWLESIEKRSGTGLDCTDDTQRSSDISE